MTNNESDYYILANVTTGSIHIESRVDFDSQGDPVVFVLCDSELQRLRAALAAVTTELAAN